MTTTNSAVSFFERTSCSCRRCSAHCRRQPGALGPGDYEALRAFTGLDEAGLDAQLVASPGAVYIEGSRARVMEGVTPARKADGACVWLTSDGLCAVHPVSPVGCRLFDAHQTAEESDRRSKWLYANKARDVAFWGMRSRLVSAGRLATGFEKDAARNESLRVRAQGVLDVMRHRGPVAAIAAMGQLVADMLEARR